MTNKPCLYNGCEIGLDKLADVPVILRQYLWAEKDNKAWFTRINKDILWYSHCPKCKCLIQERLKNPDKTV